MKTQMQMLNDEVKKANIMYWGAVGTVAVAFGILVALVNYAVLSAA